MAHSLILDDLNSGTVNLNDGSLITLMHYTPLSMNADDETVVDTIRVKFEGGTQLTMGTSISNVNRLLRQGERFVENGITNQVFLKYTPDNYGTAWYSPIVSARLELETEATDLAQWNNRTVFANLIVERKNYWELNTATEIIPATTIRNGTGLYYVGTNVTTGGDLPHVACLTFTCGTATINKKYLFALWQDKSGTVGLLTAGTPIYKECDVWGTIYGGSAVADATCSQGTAYQRVLTSTTSTTIGTLTTPFTGLNLAGNNVRSWMRFGTITSTNIQYQFGIRPDPTTSFDSWTSPWITPGTQDLIQDFGHLDFSNIAFADAPVVYLYSRLTSGTIGTLRLDYWILAPYDHHLKFESINVAGTSDVVFHGITQAMSGSADGDGGTTRLPVTYRRDAGVPGRPFHQDWFVSGNAYPKIIPNKPVVVYMQAIGVNGTALPSSDWTVRLHALPRRLNVP